MTIVRNEHWMGINQLTRHVRRNGQQSEGRFCPMLDYAGRDLFLEIAFVYTYVGV